MIASPEKRTLCAYKLENENEYESLVDYQLDLINKTHEKKIICHYSPNSIADSQRLQEK